MSSFTEEYLKLRKKRLEEQSSRGATGSNTQSNGSRPVMLNTLTPQANSDIAPVRQTEQEKQMASNDERKWFQKGAFEDGYQFGDLTKTIVSSSKDLETNVLGGILGIGEKVVDAGAYLVGGVGGLFSKDFKDNVGDFIEKDLYDEEAVARKIVGARTPMSWFDKSVMDEGNSVLGEKTDALAQSGGQLLGTIGLQAVGVPWFLTSGVTSFGSEAENALNQGATYGQAGLSAAINAGVEIATEKLFGGSGLGEKGLINLDGLTKGISNKVGKALLDLGVDMAAEGMEEIAAQIGSNFASALYSEKNLQELLFSEEAFDEYLESFIGGMALGGVANVGKVGNSIKTGRDYRTGLTENEQKVFDNVYNKRVAEAQEGGKELSQKDKDAIYDAVMKDLEKGRIDTDTIEEVLGGAEYESYKQTVAEQDALQKEIDEIRQMKKSDLTVEQDERYNEIKQKLADMKGNKVSEQTKAKLSEAVQSRLMREVKGEMQVADNYLAESYNEKARGQQRFEADLSQYDKKQQDHVKRALESGVLNNRNSAHEIVGLTAKIEADKGVRIHYVNNKMIKDMGIEFDGVDANGFVKDGEIYINVESPKYLQFIVGHEITHTMEQHKELYAEMQKALFDVAKSKGEYDSRLEAVTKTYKKNDPTADPTKELTADLVGDYLFTDEDFVRRLSTEHRNVFQKVWDEIKHLWKMATAGSKEARELEKAMHLFEKVYKESGKTSEGTKYSLDMVDAVKPTTNKWTQGATTDEVRAAHPTLYAVDETATEERNPTQVKGTVGSYRKVYESLKNEGFNGTILDASSGLGYGTKAGIEEYGFDVEDIEPYPDSDYKPKYTDYSALNKKYDVVISNAVLNVLPQDQRDALTVKMGELLNPGGRMFVNVRGKDVLNASGKIAINESNMEYFIPRTAKTGSYQKGFTKSELVAYLEDALGEGFTVKPTNMFGAVSAIVTKDGAKYSLTDSNGKQLTKGQQEYFKDSKMRDENGNLKIMYHGSQDAGFHIFDPAHSDDETSLFFVDRNDVAASYSGTYETYEAKTIRSAKDMNNFLAEIGYDHYEAVEKNGKFELLENNEHVAYSNTAQGLYEEFCWYEGVGEGDANYKVYLNLTNPLVVDAEGRNWNNITREYSQEVADRYNSLTAEEKAALSNLAEWGEYSIFKDEMLDARAAAEQGVSSGYGDVAFTKTLARAYQKLGGANANLYDAFSIASDNFSAESIQEFAVKQMNTRDYAQKAKAEGYDGVIFNNIVDVGGYGNGSEGASTVAIAFDSNQIKSVANEQPGKNADIRYSLSSDSEGRKLSDEQKKYFNGSKVVDANGNLKVMHHGSPETFTVFDRKKAKSSGTYGNGFYFTDSTSHAATYGDAYDVYLNITNPLQNGTNDITKDQIRKFVEAIAEDEDYGIDNYGYDATIDSVTDSVYGKSDFAMILDLNISCVGNMVEAIELFNKVNGTDYDGIIAPTETVAFYPNQIKSVDNLKPTVDPDIRFSLSKADDDYISAVESGDMQTAQRLVEDAANKAGYTIRAYHGTPNAEFTVFDKDRVGKGNDQYGAGFYFTTSKTGASHYGNRVIDAALNIKNPIRFRATSESGRNLIDADITLTSKQAYEVVKRLPGIYDAEESPLGDYYDAYWEVGAKDWMVRDLAEQYKDVGYLDSDLFRNYPNELHEALRDVVGFDGVEVTFESTGEKFYVAWFNNQIKSIDTVTRDDSGNVIPLSERFNAEKDDIRNSLSPEGEPQKRYGNYNIYGKDVRYEAPMQEQVAPVEEVKAETQKPVALPDEFAPIPEEEANAMQSENIAHLDDADAYAPQEDDIAPVAATTEETSEVPVKEQYEAIKPERKKSTEPRLKRVKDSETSADGKQRKWIGTSTDSEAVDGKVTPDDIPDDMRYYQPIPNKVTLGNANSRLNSMGYDSAMSYFNSQFANKRVSLEDIALGERLIQEAVKRGDTKTASELIQNVSILGTELGQKVQALSIIKRLSPEGQLRMLQKTVERGKTRGDKSFEGVEITQEMIDHILKTYGKDGTYDQTKLNEAVEDVKKQIADQMKVTKLEKVNAWRYLSMLGNPKTHIRNLVSNVAMRGTVAVKNALARTIESVAPIENRTKTWKRASDAVKAFSQKTALEMKDVLSDGGKYSEEASIKANRDTFKNKVLNKVYNFNSDLLSKEDWWFSKPAFTNALSEYLTANGIVTEQDIANNPKIVAKAKQYATEQSQIATFRQYSWLANKINDIERHNTVTNIAVGAVLPFKKTPINIAKTGLNYSPLGFAKTLTYDVAQVKNGKMEASELVDHLSQNITGTALTLIGYMLASSGFLNGAGEDDKEGKYDYQLGEQAYSINIGDATFSLSWLSPIAMPLFVGANAYEQLVEGKEWNGDVVVQTLAQTLDPLSEMSFLSSLDSVLSSYDSGIMKFAGIAQTAAQSYTSQFAPTLLSQVAAVMDDTKRTTKVAGDSTFKAFDEIINNLKYKIPGLRETLEPTTDIWGNEVKQTEDMLTRAFETFIAPYSKREDIATEIDSEIKSLYSMTGDDGLIPSIPYNYINYKNEKYEMSAKEYTAYKETYGQTAYNLLGELFDTETYRYASDEDKAEMVNKVYDYARDVAKQEFLTRKGVNYTNAKKDGEAYYKEDGIKGAIEHDMMLDEYSFYREYPEKYAVAKSVGGYEKYKTYASDLYDIKADKDASGKSITGSRKQKVADYINNLDISYGEKIILFKSEYNADDTYNAEIVQYLNNRNDISYDEMVAILRELGFTVKGNTVTWD